MKGKAKNLMAPYCHVLNKMPAKGTAIGKKVRLLEEKPEQKS